MLWDAIPVPASKRYPWDKKSTYIQPPPFFSARHTDEIRNIVGARALCILGDSVTTDHISPAGSIKPSSPAGEYLRQQGVDASDFNSYGARRGNHEVMVRGTFANIRIKNLMVPGTEGGITLHYPHREKMSIFAAAMKYKAENVPLIVFAGEEYGSGSSRDWAAKGPQLLGVKAVVAKSYERIHRSNLVGMGILPCEFLNGENAQSLNLDGSESFDLTGLTDGLQPNQELTLTLHRKDSSMQTTRVRLRIDSPMELGYYRHGGILPYVLGQMAGRAN
jgi:aconitate hydratase